MRAQPRQRGSNAGAMTSRTISAPLMHRLPPQRGGVAALASAVPLAVAAAPPRQHAKLRRAPAAAAGRGRALQLRVVAFRTERGQVSRAMYM